MYINIKLKYFGFYSTVLIKRYYIPNIIIIRKFEKDLLDAVYSSGSSLMPGSQKLKGRPRESLGQPSFLMRKVLGNKVNYCDN